VPDTQRVRKPDTGVRDLAGSPWTFSRTSARSPLTIDDRTLRRAEELVAWVPVSSADDAREVWLAPGDYTLRTRGGSL
jgi:hypothetical protein